MRDATMVGAPSSTASTKLTPFSRRAQLPDRPLRKGVGCRGWGLRIGVGVGI